MRGVLYAMITCSRVGEWSVVCGWVMCTVWWVVGWSGVEWSGVEE